MRGDELICPEGKSMLDVCLPSPLIAFSASKRASLRKSKSRFIFMFLRLIKFKRMARKSCRGKTARKKWQGKNKIVAMKIRKNSKASTARNWQQGKE